MATRRDYVYDLACRVGDSEHHIHTLAHERIVDMDAHVHISPVHLLAGVAFTLAFFGTLHLLALSSDNRLSRALIALGF